MTYRSVGSSTGGYEFVGTENGGKPFNDFGSGDIPLSASNYQELMDNGGNIMHVPFVMGGIAIFHSVPGVAASSPIHLDGCTLAKVFMRTIMTWDDPEIMEL